MNIKEFKNANRRWFRENEVAPVASTKASWCEKTLEIVTECGWFVDKSGYDHVNIGVRVVPKKKFKFHRNGYVLSGNGEVIGYWYPTDYSPEKPALVTIVWGNRENVGDPELKAWFRQSHPEAHGGCLFVHDGAMLVDALADTAKGYVLFSPTAAMLACLIKRLKYRTCVIEPI